MFNESKIMYEHGARNHFFGIYICIVKGSDPDVLRPYQVNDVSI